MAGLRAGTSARPTLVRAVTILVAGIIVVVLAGVGFTGRSGPGSSPLPRVDRVVLLSVPGLRWQDLTAVETPTLDRWLAASALLSVRAIGPETSLLEGYLTLGSGNRVEVPTGDVDEAALVPSASTSAGGPTCLPALAAAATRAADDDLNGAVPGALGTALSEGGLRTAVYGGPEAIGALMDEQGCVGDFAALDELGAVAPPGGGADVMLVEYQGLQHTRNAAERTELLGQIDAAAAGLGIEGDPDHVAVLVVAPSARDDAAEVTVVGVGPATPDGGRLRSGRLLSSSTRRAGYVTLTDVAPTVLQLLGVSPSDDMSGATMATTGGTGAASDEAGELADQIADLADVADRIEFRDRAVGPISVSFVVLIVLCGAAALARRNRLARSLAPVVAAYPAVTFLLGVTPYHRLPLAFFVVITLVIAMFVSVVAVSVLQRVGPWAPTTALSVGLWAILVIDVITGGALQINTPLGYTPTIAGRFQGFGNLAFGLVASAAMVAAVSATQMSTHPPGDVHSTRRDAAWFAAVVGAVTLVAVAAPAFGSDVGGTLALIPAFGLMVMWLDGRRVSWQRGLIAIGVAVAAVGVLALIDRARPEASRTHLGRFLDELLDGDGSLILRRKLRGNIAILTSSFWTLILAGLIVVVGVWCWRRRDWLLASVADRPAVAAFSVGWAVAAALGFALNDSGLVVPAVMLGVAVAWLVSVIVPVSVRQAR